MCVCENIIDSFHYFYLLCSFIIKHLVQPSSASRGTWSRFYTTSTEGGGGDLFSAFLLISMDFAEVRGVFGGNAAQKLGQRYIYINLTKIWCRHPCFSPLSIGMSRLVNGPKKTCFKRDGWTGNKSAKTRGSERQVSSRNKSRRSMCGLFKNIFFRKHSLESVGDRGSVARNRWWTGVSLLLFPSVFLSFTYRKTQIFFILRST